MRLSKGFCQETSEDVEDWPSGGAVAVLQMTSRDRSMIIVP